MAAAGFPVVCLLPCFGRGPRCWRREAGAERVPHPGPFLGKSALPAASLQGWAAARLITQGLAFTEGTGGDGQDPEELKGVRQERGWEASTSVFP